jgi:glycosyltransferase involved in cell wall biosynthesis
MTDRPHVVHLIQGIGYGGAERITLELVVALHGERFDRTLCITRDDVPDSRREVLEAFRRTGGRLLVLPRRGWADVWAWRPLVALLRTGDVRLVHGHLAGSGFWAALLGRACRVPAVVVHDHGSPPTLGWRLRAMHRTMARLAHAIIVVSEADRQRWIQVAGAPAGRVHTIPNAAFARPPQPPVDLRAELGVAPEAPLIGCVGGMRPEKAQVVLLEALSRLRDRGPAPHVVLVGRGVEWDALARRAAELGVEDRVHMLGLRQDVDGLLPSFAVAVLPSDREGSPLSLLEYMQAGRPIVATRVGGVPEHVRDGVDAVLVPPRAPDAMAAAIDGLLDDPARARQLGESARRRAASEFSAARVTERIEALYDALLAQTRS